MTPSTAMDMIISINLRQQGKVIDILYNHGYDAKYDYAVMMPSMIMPSI